MKTSLTTLAQEIGHWRNFFRTRDAALARAAQAARGREDLAYDELPTEWAETEVEWFDTLPGSLVIDPVGSHA
ncbi:MAG: hypothetical protein KF788_22385 [Piscinibacter sp.]|nr:hypothetical protein [Piscinibacter sp.]